MRVPEFVAEHTPHRVHEYFNDADHPDPLDVRTPPESWLVSATALGAGVLTRRGLEKVWSHFRGGKPPENPAAPGVTWVDALIWAAAAGATIGVARVISRRAITGAVRTWKQ